MLAGVGMKRYHKPNHSTDNGFLIACLSRIVPNLLLGWVVPWSLKLPEQGGPLLLRRNQRVWREHSEGKAGRNSEKDTLKETGFFLLTCFLCAAVPQLAGQRDSPSLPTVPSKQALTTKEAGSKWLRTQDYLVGETECVRCIVTPRHAILSLWCQSRRG